MLGDTRLTGPHGEDLILVFDHDALIAAEDSADKPIVEVVEGAYRGRLGYIGKLLYGGLRRNHPRLSLADADAIVGNAVKSVGLLPLQEALFKALDRAMPKRAGDVDPPKAPEDGSGTPSSEPGARKGSTRKASGGKPRGPSPSQ